MVKRSGIRISLAEMAAALVNVEPVSAAVCIPYDEQGRLGIVAFVTTSATTSGQMLRRALASLLPPTMLPDRGRDRRSDADDPGEQGRRAEAARTAGLRPPGTADEAQRRSS